MPQSKVMQRRIERKNRLKEEDHSCADCRHNEEGMCSLVCAGGWGATAQGGPCVDWDD